MREIKFRVWVLPTKRMVEVTGLCYQSHGVGVECLRVGCSDIDDPGQVEFWWKDTEAILRQYTGLHDKNGTEIYEGDILYQDCYGDGNETGKTQVRFGQGTFDSGYYRFIGWHCGEDHSAQDVLLHSNGTIEVIGNIHENQGLLK